MARQRLNVGDIFELPDGHLVIGLYTRSDELRDQWRNTPIPDVKSQYEGKKIHVFGEGYQFETEVLDVDISNSIADFKNVFLKLDNNEWTKRIQIDDAVEVEV
ncbi:MAG: hypothetical protein IPN95_21745 [Bacteroidetes bacterium]|nr:hypothetical protein [Bacteroidota bacterium]